MSFKVLGKKVLIEKPVTPESPVVLDEKIKKELEKEMIAKWSKLPIAVAGEECTLVKAGDLVYVGRALEHSEVILIDEKTYFMVNEAQISIVW